MANKFETMAIAYDFDGTLAPGNMQQHSFIPTLGIDSTTFWKEVKQITKDNNMNEILAYMFLMLKKANANSIKITRKAFMEHGTRMDLFLGVADYFDKINEYAKSKNLKVEHYIISS